MAVASHQSQARQNQYQQYAPSAYNPSTASSNTPFFGNNINSTPSRPEFTFDNSPNNPTPIPSWASHRPFAIPRSTPAPSFSFSSPAHTTVDDISLPSEEQVPELMNDQNWQTHSQPQQRLGQLPTSAHQRNSSLSTLGSAGPSSPFTQTSSTPRIAVSDSDPDGLSDLTCQDAMTAMYAPKPGMHSDSFYSQYPSSLSHTRVHHQQPHHHQQHQHAQSHNHQPHGTRTSLLPPGDFQQFSPSNPVSVASSVAGDSPTTPSVEDHHHHHQPQHHHSQPTGSKRQNQPSFNPNVPKLDRTMTDVYSDELYNPNFSITTTVSPSTPTSAVSPSSDVFSQRIHAANNQHLSAAQSPATTISRDRSPFRHGSPLAPLSHDMNVPRMAATPQQDIRYRVSEQQQIRDHVKQDREAAAAAIIQQQQQNQQHQQHNHQQQHVIPSRASQHQQDSIKTISPKDALLEFSETGDSVDFPLFPQNEHGHSFLGIAEASSGAPSSQPFGSMSVTAQDASFGAYMPATMSQYGFMARDQDGDIHLTDSASHLRRHHQQHQGQSTPLPASPRKPSSSATSRGTFSCTYQGCPLRFETAALLQKHKREGHRQAHGLGGARRDSGLVPGVTSTQNGPHKCTQINPSTGKPCNIEFSRPYDLTRHEDTIHNPKKKKVTCPACTDKKQFSRGDALSRHYRVCHPELTPPGKRRGGGSRG